MTDRLLPGNPPKLADALADLETARLELDLEPDNPTALAAYTHAATWLMGSAAIPPSCGCPSGEATRALGVAGLLLIDLTADGQVTEQQRNDVGATLGAIVTAVEYLNTIEAPSE